MAMGNGKAEPAVSQEEAKALAIDLEKRVQGFNGELIPLLGKYKVGLGAVAFLTPDGRIAARPQLFNDSNPHPKVDGDQADPKAVEQKKQPELTEG